MAHPKVLLISLRDPSDPMAAQEQLCFAGRAALDRELLDLHFAQSGPPDRALLRRYDAVFFGGSGAYSVLDDVDWIRAAFGTLQDVVELRVRAWASCFGFQGLAVALGGEVVRDDDRQELGAFPIRLTEAGKRDPILSVLPERFFAQEGHHDHVTRLPRGVTLLATGELSENQAFVVDGAPFYASQFHPELTSATTVERFMHYAELYSMGAEAKAVADGLAAGEDTPEMAQVLTRLVWER